MCTTPFQLVCGLNPILPIEFSLFTPKVAKALEWTIHELSNGVQELENLDETRFLSTTSMNVEKL